MSVRRLPRALAARLFAFAFACTLGGAAVAVIPAEAPQPPRAVVTAADAYLLGEPSLLAGPRIRGVHPSPDGPFALIVREPPVEQITRDVGLPAGGETQVLLWNRASGRVSVLWSEPFTGKTAGGVSQVEWLPGTTAALAVVGRYTLAEQAKDVQGELRLLLIDTRQARPRDIGPVSPGEQLITGDAPFGVLYSQDLSAAVSSEPRGQKLRVVRSNGTLGAPVAVPDGITVLPFYGLDAAAGVFATRQGEKDPQTGRRKVSFFAVGLSDGAPQTLPVRPQRRTAGAGAMVSEKIAALPFRLVTRAAVLRPGGDPAVREDRINAAYLESAEKDAAPSSKDSRALVAPDAEAVTLTPDGEAALYRTRTGSLYAAPVLRRDAAEFVAARREYWKAQTMSNAKQAGLALLMYAMDYDETLPPAENVQGIVSPYLKNDAVFLNPETGQAAFTYVRPGSGKIGDVQSPAGTVLGYLNGPGGRAVLYVDGHVKWEDTP